MFTTNVDGIAFAHGGLARIDQSPPSSRGREAALIAAGE
jgi:hypothetical protein